MKEKDFMKEKELRAHAVCDVCGKRIGESKLPLFATVTLRRYAINLDAMRRQDGLTAMLGGHARLAMVMGPDEDLAKEYADEIDLTICANCQIEKSVTIAELIGIGIEKEDQEDKAK